MTPPLRHHWQLTDGQFAKVPPLYSVGDNWSPLRSTLKEFLSLTVTWGKFDKLPQDKDAAIKTGWTLTASCDGKIRFAGIYLFSLYFFSHSRSQGIHSFVVCKLCVHTHVYETKFEWNSFLEYYHMTWTNKITRSLITRRWLPTISWCPIFVVMCLILYTSPCTCK